MRNHARALAFVFAAGFATTAHATQPRDTASTEESTIEQVAGDTPQTPENAADNESTGTPAVRITPLEKLRSGIRSWFGLEPETPPAAETTTGTDTDNANPISADAENAASKPTNRLQEIADNPAVAGAAGATATAGAAILGFWRNIDWSRIDPSRYTYAGTRGQARAAAEAVRVWERVPVQVRMAGPSATTDYLAGKDWSHIRPVSTGGGNSAANGVWEAAGLNRSRGAAVMTTGEIRAAAARRPIPRTQNDSERGCQERRHGRRRRYRCRGDDRDP